MTDYHTAPIEPEMKRLLFFAEKMAKDASHITPEDIETVRAAGFSDRAILDAAHVTGFFSYMNRVVQALGVDTKRAMSRELPATTEDIRCGEQRPQRQPITVASAMKMTKD